MEEWVIIQLEGYCGREWNYLKCKDKYYITYGGAKIPNPYYDPGAIFPDKPVFCPDVPCYTCLENDCKFFVHCELQEE